MSVTSIILFGCETWYLLADSEKKDPGFQNQVHEELLCISYLMHSTNRWVWSKITSLLAAVKRWELASFRLVTHHNSFSKTILQGILGVEG